jgi:putative tricarboxylic transport membrane protein
LRQNLVSEYFVKSITGDKIMSKSRSVTASKGNVIFGIMTAMVAILIAFTPLAAKEFSLKGETVSIVIGFPPGSGDDQGVRQLAPFLEKRLPGNPTVIVINKPGAGGVLAANSFYNTTKGDGTTIGMFTGFALKMVLKESSIRFDINKMNLLGIQSTNQVTLVSKDTGIETAADLVAFKKQLIVGTSSKLNAAYAANVSFLDILGVQHMDLTGYRGAGELLQAMRTKELTVSPFPWTLYMARKGALTKEGFVTAISQRGYLKGDGSVAREPALGVPTQDEIIRKYKPEAIGTPEHKAMTFFVGLFAVTRSYWLPPKTDPEIVTAWRRALEDAYASTEFRNMIKKQTKMDVIFHDADDGRKLFDSIIASYNDPAIRQAINKSIGK